MGSICFMQEQYTSARTMYNPLDITTMDKWCHTSQHINLAPIRKCKWAKYNNTHIYSRYYPTPIPPPPSVLILRQIQSTSIMGGHNTQASLHHYQGGWPSWTNDPSGISAIHSTIKVSRTAAHIKVSSPSAITSEINESDSNADTYCLWENWIA